MKSGPRIAIIGAGLGGATAAITLQQLGHDVDVYEQAGRLERIGLGIGLTSNSTHICAKLGLLDRMEAAGHLPRERHSRDGLSGELTLDIPVAGFKAKYGGPHIVMRRGELHDIFVSAMTPDRLHLGKQLVDLRDDGSAVHLSFADGSVATADIVIGADGIHSRVRACAVDDVRSFYGGEVAHRSIFPRERLGDMTVGDMTKWFSGTDRYVMVFYLTPGKEDIYYVTGFPQAEWTTGFGPQDTDPQAVVKAFADYCPDVQRILGAATEATTWPIFERDPVRGWSRGNIVLLGDAVHGMRPHMGQGAGMAIEDAVVLARCIDHFGRDSQSAFTTYEGMRYDRTTSILLGSRHNTWMRGDMNVDELYGYDPFTLPLTESMVPS
jgi:6-hydroxynicotinate 3-monooxygenase